VGQTDVDSFFVNFLERVAVLSIEKNSQIFSVFIAFCISARGVQIFTPKNTPMTLTESIFKRKSTFVTSIGAAYGVYDLVKLYFSCN
jgi:hypothetical protein